VASSRIRIVEISGKFMQADITMEIEIQRPKYSVCITNYNSIDTIRGSMESIFHELNASFEIVVCDNCSNDGSREILQEYAKKGKIKLVVEKSSRGQGRQIAFENSIGKYVISGVDTDDTLKPAFQKFLRIYHRSHEGYMLSASTIHIIPRKLVEEIGGWRDLKYGEDVDFHKRAKSLGRQHEFEYPLVLVERGNNKRGFIDRLAEIYYGSQSAYRIGKSISNQVKMAPGVRNKPIVLVVAVVTLVECKCKHIQKFSYPNSPRTN
jgi:glycosyltransferase involved in cell wall biosynthesis